MLRYNFCFFFQSRRILIIKILNLLRKRESEVFNYFVIYGSQKCAYRKKGGKKPEINIVESVYCRLSRSKDWLNSS